MIPYLFLFAYFIVLYASLWKLFVKAGRKAWEGWVPFYNLYVWNKLIGKPWWWLLLLLVPGVNLLMLIIMNVNISIAFGERAVKDHVVMTFLPWWKVPQIAFQERYKYVGPIPHGQRKRNLAGQWGDAILFAVIVATVFRTFTFEAFTIPTPSMEKSLLVGDYLFVSKLSYGPRMPMTPITFPFTHHTLPLTTSTPSFVNWFSQPYRRLPGFGTPQRGDAVVFNFPEGDTVVANFQNQSYYQLVRDYGRKNVWNANYRQWNLVDGRPQKVPMGGVLARPTDKQENYIKRCVAIAGDSLEVRDGYVWVNGEKQEVPPQAQYAYEFKLRDRFNTKVLKEQLDINPDDVQQIGPNEVSIPLSADVAEKLKGFGNVIGMTRQNHPRGYSNEYHKDPFFPNDARFDWSEDNYGPIWIPKAGTTIDLTTDNLPLFRRLIEVYEGHDLEVKGTDIHIDGVKTSTYTIEQDYYWLMGDNRHRSQDSRFWGYVPHDHVVGKAVLVWLTVDPQNGGFPAGIRWRRLFTKVR